MYLVELAKKIAFRHTSLGKPKYPFNIEPIQLVTLVNEIERLKDTQGAIVEIGVARGMTTRFVCEHIVKSAKGEAPAQRVIAIDTFQSFVPSQVEYEMKHRGGERADIRSMFSYNDFEVWKRNFAEFPFVTVFQSDCAVFDYSAIAPIKVTFLDVDLYLPTKAALPKLFEATCSDGVILLDDIQGNFGAKQAYLEFCESMSITPQIIGNKCGVIRKSTTAS